MRRLAFLAFTACSLVEGGSGDVVPDATTDAPIDAAKDAAIDAVKDAMAEAAPTDGGADGAMDSGIDTGPADTGVDTGCMMMICPCAQAGDCRNGNEVCLLNICTPCGFLGTDNRPCQNGQTCHQPSSMCK